MRFYDQYQTIGLVHQDYKDEYTCDLVLLDGPSLEVGLGIRNKRRDDVSSV